MAHTRCAMYLSIVCTANDYDKFPFSTPSPPLRPSLYAPQFSPSLDTTESVESDTALSELCLALCVVWGIVLIGSRPPATSQPCGKQARMTSSWTTP